MDRFIEYEDKIYTLKDIQITKESEFLNIILPDTKIIITGSDVTLPMKYNVLKEFLDKGLIYNQQHDVITFDDINKPDTYNTDGVYRGELITNVQVLRTSRLKVTFNNDKTKIINLRKFPFWFLIRDYNFKEFVSFTSTDIKWDIKAIDKEFTPILNIKDIIAAPTICLDKERELEDEDPIEVDFKDDLKEGEIDAFELANKCVFNPLIPKKKKHRTISMDKVAIDIEEAEL